jgi:hypothetical protein
VSARCDNTDLLVDQCAHCRNLVDPEEEMKRQRSALVASGRWLRAVHKGKCARCGEWFNEGAAIQRSVDDGGWIADCCSDAIGSDA